MATELKNEARNSIESKTNAECVEENAPDITSAEQMLEQWPLLRDKTPQERDNLNKKLLRKLDWIFLPCVTLMLIMW